VATQKSAALAMTSSLGHQRREHSSEFTPCQTVRLLVLAVDDEWAADASIIRAALHGSGSWATVWLA
jgi:hypothetical protein